jgi:hypothetical protein
VIKAGEVQAFLSTLTPARSKWTWVGRTAIMRVSRGAFQLSIYSGNTSGIVAGLSGVFTSDAGTQEHITFRFEDFLVADNFTGNPNWNDDSKLHVYEHCGWKWYIARPVSLRPLHDAISTWVELLAPSKHFSRAKGPVRS